MYYAYLTMQSIHMQYIDSHMYAQALEDTGCTIARHHCSSCVMRSNLLTAGHCANTARDVAWLANAANAAVHDELLGVQAAYT